MFGLRFLFLATFIFYYLQANGDEQEVIAESKPSQSYANKENVDAKGSNSGEKAESQPQVPTSKRVARLPITEKDPNCSSGSSCFDFVNRLMVGNTNTKSEQDLAALGGASMANACW